ncbi:MAG: GIY-YIG nuclease family protein [Acidobacteriota bacterium]|nr:GIY-YIG nuclease family protein [Acidobacteriota bacterium]MDQ7087136.1 GIY-YIG nuclease family protein [Acidobacteriota bacterium]
MPAISYQLLILLGRPVRLQVGALGRFCFPAGRWVYTGSARRHMDARLARHLAGPAGKRLRWHIDYLLAHPAARIVAWRRSPVAECRLQAATPGDTPIPGFGASDCRAGCGAHLKLLPEALGDPPGRGWKTP